MYRNTDPVRKKEAELYGGYIIVVKNTVKGEAKARSVGILKAAIEQYEKKVTDAKEKLNVVLHLIECDDRLDFSILKTRPNITRVEFSEWKSETLGSDPSCFKHVTVLDVTFSDVLKLDLSGMSSLRELYLRWYSGPLPKGLDTLKHLHVSGCKAVRSFPKGATNLETLHLSGVKFDADSDAPESHPTLRVLEVDACTNVHSRALPTEYPGLLDMKMSDCGKILSVPTHVPLLASFEMKRSWYGVIPTVFPETTRLDSLRKIYLMECDTFERLHDGMSGLIDIIIVRCKKFVKCRRLPLSLQTLDLIGCDAPIMLPHVEFPNLTTLRLQKCGVMPFENLPINFRLVRFMCKGYTKESYVTMINNEWVTREAGMPLDVSRKISSFFMSKTDGFAGWNPEPW